MQQIQQVLVVGGGTAGFMAAMALKTKLPRLTVTVVRSPEIGIIGVGEGSAPPFTRFIHEVLGIPVSKFVRETNPGLKTGTCFIWGPREKFFFPFGLHTALKVNALPKPIGYYLDHGDPDLSSPNSAKMAMNRPFGFNENKSLLLNADYAYHVENDRLSSFLEAGTRALGVTILDATIESVAQNGTGIESVKLADGRVVSADLFVDCSGFRSLLLGQAFKEPRVDYGRTLFCDRTVVGGWDRPPGLAMKSYTVAETMDAGWCWRIDHPDRIHRGYVYSSAFITDDAAELELRSKNPELTGPTRIVKFTSGRFKRSWVKNVIALGNASGFVEPLEATSLAINGSRCELLCDLLIDSDGQIGEPMRQLYNLNTASIWDAVRDFLSLHYRFNTRLETPFWKHCRTEVDTANAQPVIDYYKLAGPTTAVAAALVDPAAAFGISSYLAILTGQKVPCDHPYQPSDGEINQWKNWCEHNGRLAQMGATTEQALAIIAGGRKV